jgi:hypothetical protein
MELLEGWQFAALGLTSKQRHIIRDDAGLPLCNRHGKLKRTGQLCDPRYICRNCYDHQDSPFKYRQPTDRLPGMTKQQQLLYLAGLLDNRGTFRIARMNGWRSLRIELSTRHPYLIGWLHTHFGGLCRHRDGGYKQWVVQGNEAAKILASIVAYMPVRGDVAYRLLKDFREYKIKHGRVSDAATEWFHLPKSRASFVSGGE